MGSEVARAARYGMVIDLDRCLGCGTCTVACAIENNVSLTPPIAQFNRALSWLRVYNHDSGQAHGDYDTVHIPVPCQQCSNPPCLSVCPVSAVAIDPRSGIVAQIPVRCMGCRYCMAACPYHVRTFNWWDSKYPNDQALNPDVSPRMRGVVEKCNFCSHRLQRAKQKAVTTEDNKIESADFQSACCEACPSGTIVFGNLADEKSAVASLAKSKYAFRLLESLGTETNVYYYSQREWVRELGRNPGFLTATRENSHG